MFLLKAQQEVANKKDDHFDAECGNEQFDTECLDNSNNNTSDAEEVEDRESDFVNSGYSSEPCKYESLASDAKLPEDSQDPALSAETFNYRADNEPCYGDLAQYWRALEATRYYGMRAGITLAKHKSHNRDLNSEAENGNYEVYHDIDCGDSCSIPDEVRKSSKLSVIPEHGFKRSSDKSIAKKYSSGSISFEDMRNAELEDWLEDDLDDQDILKHCHKISGDEARYSSQIVTAVYSVEVPINSVQGPFGYRVSTPKLPWKSPLHKNPFSSRIFRQQRLLQNDIHNFDKIIRTASKKCNSTAMEENSISEQYKYCNQNKENGKVQAHPSSTSPPQHVTQSHPSLQRNIQNDRCSTMKNTERSQMDGTSYTGAINGKTLREYEMEISKAVLTGVPVSCIPTSALRQLSPKVPANLHERLQALKSNVDKSRVKSRSWYRKKNRDGFESSCSTVTCSSADPNSTRRDDRLDDGDCSPDVNTLRSISTETIIIDKQSVDAEIMNQENISKDIEKFYYKPPEKNSASIKTNDDKKCFEFGSLTHTKIPVTSQQKIGNQNKHCFEIESSGETSEALSSLMPSDRSAASKKLRGLARKHCVPDSDMKLFPGQKWVSEDAYSGKKGQFTNSNLKDIKRRVFEYRNIHYDSDFSSAGKQVEGVVNVTKAIEIGVDKDELSGYSHVTTTGLGFISHRDEKKSSQKSDNLLKSPEISSRSSRSGKRNVSVNSQLAESENCITLCTIGVQAALSSRSFDSKQQMKKHNKSTHSSESTSTRDNAKGSNDMVYLDINTPSGRRLKKKEDNLECSKTSIERSKRCILDMVERALNKELAAQDNEVSLLNDVVENNILYDTAATTDSRTNSAGRRFTMTEARSSDDDLAASPLYVRQLQEMRNNQIRHIQQEVQQLESLNRILDAFHPVSPTTKSRGDPIQ